MRWSTRNGLCYLPARLGRFVSSRLLYSPYQGPSLIAGPTKLSDNQPYENGNHCPDQRFGRKVDFCSMDKDAVLCRYFSSIHRNPPAEKSESTWTSIWEPWFHPSCHLTSSPIGNLGTHRLSKPCEIIVRIFHINCNLFPILYIISNNIAYTHLICYHIFMIAFK